MRRPPLLHEREHGAEFAVAVVVPLLFGAVVGLTLGASEPVYLVLSVLGIAGGYLAGLEHDVPLEGLYRGLLGGLLFGTGILVAHGVSGAAPKADLPDPDALLLVVTGGIGSLLGLLGARSRAKDAARRDVAVSSTT